ncbi:MAG: prepilin-type N-terminal cleavage/methylation domain-containing protein [Candidatus Xenobia bacterium]
MRRGFTLIEVLFALGLFALVAIPMMNTDLQCANALRRADKQRLALTICTAVLDDIQKQTITGNEHRSVDGWDVNISVSEYEGLPIPMQQVNVTVGQGPTVYASLDAYRKP